MSNWDRILRGYPRRGTRGDADERPGCMVFPLPCGCGCCYGAVLALVLALIFAITTFAK